MPTNPSLASLVTVREVAAYLGQDYDNLTPEQCDALQRLVNAVSAAMAKECRVPLVKALATEYYDGGRAMVILRRVPVDLTAAFTVLEDGVSLIPAMDGSSKTEAGGVPDFWLNPCTGVMERNGRWLAGRRVITVTYTAGVAIQITTNGAARTSASEPLESIECSEDLREACLIICKAHTDLGPTNWGTQIVGETAVRPQAWPLAARLILEFYTYPGGG